jgi:hypothetical protein
VRRTIHRWYWAWDFEKEEKWLNEMSAKGLQLVSVGFCKYVFEESARDEYTYRLELLENLPTNHQSTSYIHFLEETGVEHIGSVLRWAYFRKKVADGAFEIYSDIDSKIKHYKRIMTLFFAVIPVNLAAANLNLSNYTRTRYSGALALSILCSILIALLGFGIFKVSRKISRLKKEKLIRE